VTRAAAARRAGVMVGALLLTLAKLWLVGRNDVVAVAAPHDQLRFAEMAEALAAGRWLGDYSHMTLIRHVAYPIWLWLSGETGLPQRVGIELLLALSALALALALVRAGRGVVVALAVFACAVFQPQSLRLNDHLLADVFYAPIQLLALAAGLCLLTASEDRTRLCFSSLTALCLGVLAQTRPELPLLWGYVGALFLASLVADRSAAGHAWALAKRAALVVLPSALAIPGSRAAVAVVNETCYGVSTSNELFDSSFSDAWHALERIRAERPRPHVSVPAEVRRRAYAVSPALRRLEPFLEKQLLSSWTAGSCEAVAVCDDYADGWFHFVLRDAAALAGDHRSAPAASAAYGRIAEELTAACRNGSLACRGPIEGWLHTHVWRAVPGLPRSLVRMGALMAAEPHDPELESGNLPQSVTRAFDAAALRRAERARRSSFRVSGWAYSTESRVESVHLLSPEGRRLASTSPRFSRPDVLDHLSRSGIPAGSALPGFVLAGEANGPQVAGSLVAFDLANGSRLVVPTSQRGCAPARLLCAIDEVVDSSPAPAARFGTQRVLISWFPVATGLLTGSGVFGGIVLLVRRRSAPSEPAIWAFLAVLAYVVIARIATVALIDAAFFPAAVRYVYPAVTPYLSALVLVLDQAARSGRALQPTRSA
jgi:hypothetical protein